MITTQLGVECASCPHSYVNLIQQPIIMPHSPYRKTIYPPISNLDEFRQGLAHHRVSWESGERDKQRDELLLDIGEVLVEHCDFLEEKLAIKVIIHLLRGELPALVNRIADIAHMRAYTI